jgi:hypothetical protein
MAFSQNECKRSYVPHNIAAVTFWHKLASVNGNTTAFSKDRYLIKGRDDSNIYNFSSNLLIHTIPEIYGF